MENVIYYPNDQKYLTEINIIDFEIYPLDFLYYYTKAIKEINGNDLVFSLDYDQYFNVLH